MEADGGWVCVVRHDVVVHDFVDVIQSHADFCRIERSFERTCTQICSFSQTGNLLIVHDMYWIIREVCMHLRLLVDIWWPNYMVWYCPRRRDLILINLERLRVLALILIIVVEGPVQCMLLLDHGAARFGCDGGIE